MRSVSFLGKFTSGSRISASRSDLLKLPTHSHTPSLPPSLPPSLRPSLPPSLTQRLKHSTNNVLLREAFQYATKNTPFFNIQQNEEINKKCYNK